MALQNFTSYKTALMHRKYLNNATYALARAAPILGSCIGIGGQYQEFLMASESVKHVIQALILLFMHY